MRLTTCIYSLFLLLGASGVSAATIDFENFEGQPTVGSGFNEGVDVAAGTDLGGLSFDSDLRIRNQGFLQGPATTGWVASKRDALFNPRTYDVVGTFTGTVSSLTIGAGDACCDQDTVTLIAYDSIGNIVDQASFTGDDSEFLTVTGTGIKSFFLDVVSGGFDNITFEPELSQVPLPAGAPLLLAGLGALAITRRRKA